jgi:hypothetical protein
MSNTASKAGAALPATLTPTGSFAPDDAWWRHVFAVIDARDAAGFVALLTADAQFRFGNAPTLVGSDAIRAAVSVFFAVIWRSHRGIRLVPPRIADCPYINFAADGFRLGPPDIVKDAPAC